MRNIKHGKGCQHAEVFPGGPPPCTNRALRRLTSEVGIRRGMSASELISTFASVLCCKSKVCTPTVLVSNIPTIRKFDSIFREHIILSAKAFALIKLVGMRKKTLHQYCIESCRRSFYAMLVAQHIHSIGFINDHQ